MVKFSSSTGSESLFKNFLITIAGVLLSVVVLLNVLVPQQQNIPVSRPTSEDRGKHGLFAMHSWLTGGGVPTFSLRKPVRRISEYKLPETGNVMLISLPYANQALESEWSAINHWIKQGNTAVVSVADLYARPRWAVSSDVFATIKKLTAGEFSLNSNEITVEKDGADQDGSFELSDLQRQMELFKSKRLKLSPAIRHPLFEGIEALDAYYLPMLMQSHEVDDGHTEKTYYSIESDSARLAMGLLKIEGDQNLAGAEEMLSDMTDHYVMWLLPVDDGWIYLSAFPDLLANNVLKKSQNARWFTQLLRLHLSGTGHVIFNDYPFGLSELYDADAFFSDKRLHYTFVFIALFWLVYALLFSPRLAPARSLRKLPGNKDFVEAAAGFLSRRVKDQAVAKALSMALIDELQTKTQLRDKQLWHWLQDHPDILDDDVKILKRACGHEKGNAKLMRLTLAMNRIYYVFNRI
ncbi:MAG: hypothetical protein DRQ44_04240 [Gammaproteobacteria bacterium]|nr:MAG: hypothetical protein DRQ44_04240 [Gammaproteobacteria bacterium]